MKEICFYCIGDIARENITKDVDWYNQQWIIRVLGTMAFPDCKMCNGTGVIITTHDNKSEYE
jgi:hypothetical protein